jgi:predicted molibdopterin-dependent oxidoreductase YjgC
VLPAAVFAEKAGTTTNLEGRVTTVSQRVIPPGTARADWMVAAELADRLGHDALASSLLSVTSITDAIAKDVTAYAGATRAALDGNREGVVAVAPAAPAGVTALDDLRVSERNSYDYRLVVSRKLYDQAVATAHSPSLAALARPAAAHVNPADTDRIGAGDGAEARLSGPRGAIVLPIVVDPGVPRGSVLVPFNQAGSEITTLVDAHGAVAELRIEAVP